MNLNPESNIDWRGLVEPETPSERALLFGVLVPLGLLVFGLKLWRIVERGEVGAWWAAPDLVRSDLMMVAAFGIFAGVAFRTAGRRLPGPLVLGILQLVGLGWAILEVVAHHFYSVTGSILDLHLLVFSIGRFDETREVVVSEVTTGSLALLGGAVAVLLILPWALWLRGRRPDVSAPGRSPVSVGGLLAATVAGLGCLVVGFLPPVAEDYPAFGRANPVNLALSLRDLRAARDYEGDVEREMLDDLRLVEKNGADDQELRNVVIVVWESTRARSTTLHNPDRETTPFLKQFAKKSTVAERAYATLPHTSKALVPLLCGIEPRLRMPITEGRPGGLPARCLADLLGDRGYDSAFFQSATEKFEDRPGMIDNMGYETFVPLEKMDESGLEEANYFGYEDAVMLPSSREWLERRGEEPFFATYLTLTPHHDYRAPRRRYGRFDFADDDTLNRYLNSVHYVDQFTRDLIEQYREAGRYENTLFVIVGDHGEAFEEHGRTQHDNVIWEEGLRVPLLIHDPTNPEPRRIEHPVTQIDLVPTVLDWLGYGVEGGDYPGIRMFDTDEQRVVYGHCWYERRCIARIGDRLKYIDHFGRRPPEVYDLDDDPREQNNIADQYPERIREWRAEAYGWRRAVNSMYRRAHRDRVDDHLVDELPDGAVEQRFELGDFARHLGYKIDADTLKRGRRVTVTHYFEVLDEIPVGWNLFVHGQGGAEMLNLDHTPVDGMMPLDEWEPGSIVADEHSFRIPADWPADELMLYLGIYHGERGRVPVDGPSDGDRRALVFQKEVH